MARGHSGCLPRKRGGSSNGGGGKLPRRYIEKYLFFLLKHRWPVIGVITVTTVYFIYFMLYHMAIFTNFFDLYPPNHPYIQLYTKYRDMFGTANVVLLTVEV